MKIHVGGVFLKRRRERRLTRDAKDPWRRFRMALSILLSVLAVGTIGYTLIGLSVFEAIYQTSITITTVGYGEIGKPDNADTAYRVFTLVLVLVGASSAIYTVSVLLETVVEGSLNDGWRKRRMTVLIESLDGHVIVAGWGRVGQSIAHYAQKVGSDVVVVDLLPSDGENDPPMVIGDANDDEVLIRAGIERASVLIAALSSDSDNLSLTLTARSLRPDIFLVARTSDQRHERKFFQAGANRVVNPYEIGGSRMGAVALQPSVAEFLDEVLHDESHDVHIHEVEVPEGSPLIGTEIGRITGGNGQPVMIAIRPTGDTYHANPVSETVLGVGDVLIVLGTAAELKRLNGSLQRHKGLRYRGVGF